AALCPQLARPGAAQNQSGSLHLQGFCRRPPFSGRARLAAVWLHLQRDLQPDRSRTPTLSSRPGKRRTSLCLSALRIALGFADLAQDVADVAGGAQFAADIRREPQIALGIEKAGFGVGRQFAQYLGEGAEDRLDIARFEPLFSGHRAASAVPRSRMPTLA